jgi:hypothetical protein
VDEDSGPFGPQLYRFDTDGAVTGHWEYNHDGGACYAFGLAADSSGYVYLAGRSLDNTGTWQAGSGTAGEFGGTVSDAPVFSTNGDGIMNDTPGSTMSTSGTADIGAGGDDILVLKVLAEALPTE